MEGVRQIIGDIEQLGQVLTVIKGADAVIHLAAMSKPGIVTDDSTFRINVAGTFNVHEAAHHLGVRRVAWASSTAVLGWDWRERDFVPEYLPIDEDHPLQPQDAYGLLSKEAGEAIARSYALRGLETIAIRPAWVVSPEVEEQLRREGGRRPVRFSLFSYVRVDDLARAFRLAVEQPIVPGTALFVLADDSTVAEPLCDLLPRLMPMIGDKARSLTGTQPAVSNARAKKILGWKPDRSWRDGL
jgi:nucleoside-diphosphate-sugar epimerase